MRVDTSVVRRVGKAKRAHHHERDVGWSARRCAPLPALRLRATHPTDLGSIFMESLYLRSLPHLVFKRRSGHFGRTANMLGRLWDEMM